MQNLYSFFFFHNIVQCLDRPLKLALHYIRLCIFTYMIGNFNEFNMNLPIQATNLKLAY